MSQLHDIYILMLRYKLLLHMMELILKDEFKTIQELFKGIGRCP